MPEAKEFDWITTDWPRPGQAHDIHEIKLRLERIEAMVERIRNAVERDPS